MRTTAPFTLLAVSLALCGGPSFAEPNPERNAYFGEQHVDTSWSFDAFA